MYCKKCGTKLDDDALFCEKCGTAVKRIVPSDHAPEVKPAAEQSEEVKETGEPVSEKADAMEEKSAAAEEILSETAAEESRSGEESSDDKEPEQEPAAANTSENGSITPPEVKPQKKPVVIIAAIAAAAVIAALVFFMKPSEESKNADTRALANYMQGGKMAYDDTRLYFTGKYDSDDEDSYLYSTSYSGTDKKVVSDKDDIYSIRIIDDKILYYSSGDSEHAIGIMDKDGSNDRIIVETEDIVSDYDIASSNLYYLTEDELHCCSLEGENDEVILEDVERFIISGKCYYASEEAIYSYDLQKRESSQIYSGKSRLMLYKDDNIYFADENGLNTIPADGSGSKTTIVTDSQMGMYTIVDDTVYYVRRFTDSEIEAIIDYLNEENDPELDKFYKVALLGNGTVYSCPLSGGEPADLDTDPFIVCCLYSYPGGMYSSMGPFYSTVSVFTIEE